MRARARAAARSALFTAWHVAAFERTERLPELAGLMARVSGDAETEQTPEQQLAVAAVIAGLGSQRGPST